MIINRRRFIMAYAITGVATLDVYPSADAVDKIFEKDEEVIIFQIPYSVTVLIMGIKERELDVNGEMQMAIPALGMLVPEEVLTQNSEFLLEYNILPTGTLRRGEIREYINNDSVTNFIFDSFCDMANNNPYIP